MINEKNQSLVAYVFVFAAISIIALGMQTGALTGGMGGITMYMPDSGLEKPAMFTKIVNWQKEAIGGALFDIILTIPEKSKEVNVGENLVITLELTNFGGPGKTDTDISYIVTNPDGTIALIEHEKRIVETQTSFIKELELPVLTYGKHKLFVEMLYSNTSAIATGDFIYIPY